MKYELVDSYSETAVIKVIGVGGGDGGRHGTGKPPQTPWGQLTLGYRTRRRKDVSKLIVKSRHEAKRKK